MTFDMFAIGPLVLLCGVMFYIAVRLTIENVRLRVLLRELEAEASELSVLANALTARSITFPPPPRPPSEFDGPGQHASSVDEQLKK